MPVPKAVRRAARESQTKKEAATIPGGTDGTFILAVKSANLKESKKGPYRSVTGLGSDGKMYWAPIDMEHKPEKGQMITLKGESKGTFAEGKFTKILGPDWLAEVIEISDAVADLNAEMNTEPSEEPTKQEPQEEQGELPLKFSDGDAEALSKMLETAVKEHGIGKILTILGEIT